MSGDGFETFCPGCGSSGVIWVRLKKSDTPSMPFIFKCKCSRGKDSRRNYPQWTDALRDTYEVIKTSDRVGVAK
jgi:hypothetical protein